jgi:PHD/YefM family antitoxin component YafN of YafNO toxin-antitoxin module
MNVSHKPPATFSSREFNQDTARAKRVAKHGLVFITDRGRPSHVLMSIEEYERLKGGGAPKPFKSLAEALAQKEGGDFDFDFPEFKGHSLKPPTFDFD